MSLFFWFHQSHRNCSAQLLEKRKAKADYLSQAEVCNRLITPSLTVLSQVLRIFRGIVDGLKCLHADSIAHRDLKPANVLLTKELVPRLTDFGSSVKYDFCSSDFYYLYSLRMPIDIIDSRESTRRIEEAAQVSSMPYRSPEQFSCPIGSQLTTSVDIWVSLQTLSFSRLL